MLQAATATTRTGNPIVTRLSVKAKPTNPPLSIDLKNDSSIGFGGQRVVGGARARLRRARRQPRLKSRGGARASSSTEHFRRLTYYWPAPPVPLARRRFALIVQPIASRLLAKTSSNRVVVGAHGVEGAGIGCKDSQPTTLRLTSSIEKAARENPTARSGSRMPEWEGWPGRARGRLARRASPQSLSAGLRTPRGPCWSACV